MSAAERPAESVSLWKMRQIESIEEFYRRKFNWMPENLQQELGHFNLFRLEPLREGEEPQVPYKRRDFYKIMLIRGHSQVHYADQVQEVKKQALCFSNPHIPYKWEHLDRQREGCYCIFNNQFFQQFGKVDSYSVFQPHGRHLFELTEEEYQTLHFHYERMFSEIESSYPYKYDLLRTLVFELIHFALKREPESISAAMPQNAATRIAGLFLELLERQFPIDENHPSVQMRTASDFARQLNVHVNHLNRSVKETAGKTSSQVIAERILQEARILLKHSAWTVSEIAFALGFKEVTHFNNFFKKHTDLSPLQFRKL